MATAITLLLERALPILRRYGAQRAGVFGSYARGQAGRSTSEIAAHIGLTPRTAQSRLAKLVDRGLVIAVGSGPRDLRWRWFTTRPERTDA